jgi:BirA family transcriptional regulator, biotin operon repressor / biotin---[acetyl-CoA-carboxylase] ligase
MKHRIMQILADEAEPLSGEEISRRLEISRVAVWKHIQGLKKNGIDIQSTPRGYRLAASVDTPFPWQFGPRSARIHYHAEVDSTMNLARELATTGCPHLSIVVADKQSAGRGRLQRHWLSAEGGLYFSMVLRPDLLPREAPLVNLAVALEVVATLEACCGIRAALKWPNDVLVKERKIAGILSQMEMEGESLTFLNIGVGINLNNAPEISDKPAISALQLIGRRTPRAAFLSTFLDRFEHRLANFSRAAVVKDWKEKNITLGRRVTIATVRATHDGLAIDIDEDGALVLQSDDGTQQTVFHGDCFHLPAS